MAVKEGGADPNSNTRLRLAISNAKDTNTPRDIIDRAILKGAGPSDAEQMEEVTFEAYGPFGVALLIQTLTDNRNRTVPNIRSALGKSAGSMAAKGAVSYLFEKQGLLLFDPSANADKVMDIGIENGANDVSVQDDKSIEVTCSPDQFSDIREKFEAAGLSPASANVMMVPQTYVDLDDAQSETISKLIERLEEDDDVQEVSGNHQFSPAFLASLEEE